ncbi:beta-galactosidase trimerization domain-containing protein [Clostridium sp. NSJ-6]|uniref:Beta-galactosidase trimerization domain-containing protein n=1 Tax=Clostridium hominis TaxID=2763036 RepID=A0ABR7DC96_9CLOT|nr:alpha-amylase family protein [Clostridium hominis]MBC5628978.1 beta-galactosidase trimerization domain-containing protein [Clostridium hominis]MDU2671962.1 beta-galactosidase trimerization domain-containing protein [Clostridium sp.]
MKNLPYRQIHLDFHTSGDIPEIGVEFDKEEFGEILEKARVNSITCFSRCHHGYLYYDSKKFPERIHPHLKNKNILKEQIEVCHEKGIRVPIYLPVEWDEYTAKEHPEWVIIDENGAPVQKVFDAGFYNAICVNTPYFDFLKEQIKEIIEEFSPVDGLFIDILNIKDCCCKYCISEMRSKGINAEDRAERIKFAQFKLDRFKKEMTEFIREYDSDCDIFYNVDHIGTKHRKAIETFTHLEIESLPSGKWGYMHYPVTIRYAKELGLECIGMTGKFHTAWGDFHSIKNKEALEFECFNMLATNAGCSIGDQLHPRGRLCKNSYELIGDVYREVEKKEPWCIGAEAVTDIAVMATEEYLPYDKKLVMDDLVGATRMLQELGQQFSIIDSLSDFSKYKLIIMPDNIVVNSELKEKIDNYIKNGGKIIASYKSGLDKESNKFELDSLGVRFISEAEYSPDFIVPEGKIGEGLYNMEYTMYMKGLKVENTLIGQPLSYANNPYFNRTWEHFCSHLHTPSSGERAYPAIVGTESSIYFSHPIFSQYEANAPKWCKILVSNAIKMLIGDSIVVSNLPSTALINLNEQKKENRFILHVLHYIAQRKGSTIDIIEDKIPLYNSEFSLALNKDIKGIKLVPNNTELKWKLEDGRVKFAVEKIEGHQMIEIEY